MGVAALGLSSCASLATRRVDFKPSRLGMLKLRNCDHVITVSQAIHGVLAAAGMPAADMSVVHSGIDPARVATGVDAAATAMCDVFPRALRCSPTCVRQAGDG